jgi:Amt family ammonium transporter
MRSSDALGADEQGNVISRFGGDEFLVLINDLRNDGDALRIAERLLSALTPAYTIRGTEVHSSASIGLVTATQCLGTADEVVRNADIAMYEAKRAGRGCVIAFNEAMHERLTRHVTIENSLRRAMSSGELYLAYQPIIELGTRRLVSAEALMRWRHPLLGEVQPGEFIPIAEESRLIIALGQWLQRQACEEMVRWRLRDPQAAPASVSINVSRAEMVLGARYVEHLAAVLAETGLPPQCLQLELTERDVVRNGEAAQSLLAALQELGVRLAMDDFGSGASSLGFLRGYPFHTVKIDRHFLHDLVDSRDGLAVLHAAVNLIENLGMASVAEGVENQAQLAVLQSLGCRQAQGYFLGRPMALEALMEGARRGVYHARPSGPVRAVATRGGP